jgi:glycosyltransferase involved in cell wall biosynthesis
MAITKILLINAAGYIGGDTAMLLLGLPYLSSDEFAIHAVTIPRGKVYDFLRTLPNAKIVEMELGGKELAPANQSPWLKRAAQTVTAIARIVLLVHKEKVDVIYSGDRTVSMGISYAVSLLTRRPLMVNAQISHYLATSQLHRMVIRHAAKITVSSEHMRAKFLPYVRNPDKMVKIPNAIKIEKYDPNISGAKIREELGIAPHAPIVTLAGRLSPYKGQEEFIRAAALVLQKHPGAYFLMAGAEDVPGYLDYLKKLITELGVGKQVQLIGHRSNLPEVLASATLSTMPSHEEPFGLVALEAMAMCKPVVATRAGGVPDYFLDGEVGILIPPQDYQALAQAIIKLLDNPTIAIEMGKRGRKHIETFYNDRVYASQIANVLSSIHCRSVEYQASFGKEMR